MLSNDLENELDPMAQITLRAASSQQFALQLLRRFFVASLVLLPFPAFLAIYIKDTADSATLKLIIVAFLAFTIIEAMYVSTVFVEWFYDRLFLKRYFRQAMKMNQKIEAMAEVMKEEQRNGRPKPFSRKRPS